MPTPIVQFEQVRKHYQRGLVSLSAAIIESRFQSTIMKKTTVLRKAILERRAVAVVGCHGGT